MHNPRCDVGTCLVGIRTVGKTAFVNRLRDDEFHEIMAETNEPVFQTVMVASKRFHYNLKIIDIPGNQVECNQLFLEENPLLLLFFDLTKFEQTFEPILKYIQLISRNLSHDRTVILFGTKKDLVGKVGAFLLDN